MALHEAERLLHRIFGYSSFRESQREVIRRILQRQDTFAVMPTGGGKSLCYQIPALLFDGITLVISPLISLMQDQVDSLQQVGIPATYINSSLSASQVTQRLHKLETGQYKLLYLAPERLKFQDFFKRLQKLTISLVVIDEAHCISTWGHDFRPSYRLIPQMIHQLPVRPIIVALTATATQVVQQDIMELLSIPAEQVYISSFARKNLLFSVHRVTDKQAFIFDYLRKRGRQAGLIYTSTRKAVDQLHQCLREQGFAAAKYHAGMDDAARRQAQNQFSFDQVQVMVATNAFGMGIDKSNVRYVIHYHIPRDLESYYQEAGRAGRDGLASECILLYQPSDLRIHRYLIQKSELSEERKRYELWKLDQIDQYAWTQDCLSATILQYFGESQVQDCNKCSNCYRKEHGEKQDYTLEAQKIFSCIKRMKEKYGLSMVAKVLTGSTHKKVKQFGLDRLSTYGIMREYTQKKVLSICQSLVAEGYIQLGMNASQLPIAKLTAKAYEVLTGKQRVLFLDQPPMQPMEQEESVPASLFESLRQLRKEISEQEQVPPYAIFHDSVLHEMCQRLPQASKEMLQIQGMGEQKYQKYGHQFLAVIQKYLKTQGKKEQPIVVRTSSLDQLRQKHRKAYSPWTPKEEQQLRQQFLAGKSIDEIAVVLERQPGAIDARLKKLGLIESSPMDALSKDKCWRPNS